MLFELTARGLSVGISKRTYNYSYVHDWSTLSTFYLQDRAHLLCVLQLINLLSTVHVLVYWCIHCVIICQTKLSLIQS